MPAYKTVQTPPTPTTMEIMGSVSLPVPTASTQIHSSMPANRHAQAADSEMPPTISAFCYVLLDTSEMLLQATYVTQSVQSPQSSGIQFQDYA